MSEVWTIDIKEAIDEYYGEDYSWNPSYLDNIED